MILQSFFGALLLGSSFAFPSGSSDGSDQDTWGPYQVFEKQALVPKGWTYSGPAVNSTELHLQLYLKSNPEHDLSSKILQISTPGHTDYGQHLNSEALAQYISPSVDSIEFVMSWLSSFVDVNSIVYSSESGYLSFDTTVWSASQIFNAKFSTYQNLAGDKVITRTLEYSLPESVLSHVALVHPMAYFPRPKTVRGITPEVAPRHIPASLGLSKRAANLTEILAACSAGIYPICISTMYNISYIPPTDSQSGSALGIAGFLEQYVNITDINSFVRKYGTSESTRANPGNISIEIVNGGINNASFPGVEATLDLEYTTPFTGSLPVTYYSTGGRPPQLDDSGNLLPSNESDSEPYLEWLEYMLAKPDGEIPQVISISYSDTEQTVPRAYALHVCDLFGRLTARGVSILDASGDGGVAGTSFDDTCVSNDGLNHTQFQPTFPASCPWVTGVGSTSYIPEQGSDFSAGGFSNYFPTPDYQVNATASYIKYLDGQYEGLYNASGRGIPDVAAYGSRYETENNNSSSYHHSGASASTPVFASMIALINDYRLRQGKPVLGFLNPLLYSQGVEGVWNDITEGYSYGCGLTWNATVGWDTLTGLGSPDFGRLMDALA